MKKMITIGLLFLTGCAYSIKDVDVAKVKPEDVRTCTSAYSTCAAGGPVIGSKYETLRACKESYEICINSYRIVAK